MKTSKNKKETSILEDMLFIKKLSDKVLKESKSKQEDKYDNMSPEELKAIVNNNPDDGSWKGR